MADSTPNFKPNLSFFFLVVLLLIPFLSLTIIATGDADPDDLDGIEELIAVDEQEEAQQHTDQENGIPSSSSSPVLSRTRKIVVELNADITQNIISDNPYVLVMGYTPWCPRSAELMPQFADAANRLKELGSPVLMAKLDAERYPKAASSLQIKGFPTLLLFSNGSPQFYTGGFSAEDIVIWVRKKTGEPVVRLNSVAEAGEFVKKQTHFVLGKFDKFEGSQYEEFVKAATADNEIQFVKTNSLEIANVLFPDIGAGNLFLGLVKSEPERYTSFEGSFQMDSILQFVDYNKFPLVTTLTELNSMKVYSTPYTLQVYVFADDDDLKTLIGPLQEVARKFKSKIMFLHVNIKDENLAKPFLTLLGLEESQDTVVAAFDNKISSKYLLEAKPTHEHIQDFCSRLLDGTMPVYFKSQPIPDNTDASVQIVVGRNFDELVFSSSKNVILEVHTPWCMDCDTTSKQVDKLAKHFKGLDNLIFARIDASVNEHPKLQVTDYPTLLFYPASDKASPIKLSTKSSLKELAIFINKNTKVGETETKDEL
ncbi:hypothetical protein V2J09_022305 [Rumex salicifolius]